MGEYGAAGGGLKKHRQTGVEKQDEFLHCRTNYRNPYTPRSDESVSTVVPQLRAQDCAQLAALPSGVALMY